MTNTFFLLQPSLVLSSPSRHFSSSTINHNHPECRTAAGQSPENHNNSPVISQSSNTAESSQHQVTHSRTINQTLQSINNNNNNNNSTIAKTKIQLNVDQQISDTTTNSDYKEDEPLSEPNNNNNTRSKTSNSTSSARSCFRHHPVSRRGTEFISQQVPGFRSFGGHNKYITQKNKWVELVTWERFEIDSRDNRQLAETTNESERDGSSCHDSLCAFGCACREQPKLSWLDDNFGKLIWRRARITFEFWPLILKNLFGRF